MRFAAGVDARGSGIEDHWLFGRSDDGSIALLYASRFSGKTSGVVVAAPHIHVGNITVESIRQARPDAGIARYYADVDSALRPQRHLARSRVS
jgi:alpha-beta hydrolase superfamily lysophospholipase